MTLHVHGLVGIPRTVQIQEVKLNSGWLLCFTVSAPNQDGPQKFYRYPCKLWVPDDAKEAVMAKIVGGSVFSIETAKWAMKEIPNSKYAIPELQMSYKDFIKLEKPLWYKEEE